MQLYNKKTKKIEYLVTVKDGKMNMYTSKLSDERLAKLGYLRVRIEPYPENIGAYDEVEPKDTITETEYIQGYEVKRKELTAEQMLEIEKAEFIAVVDKMMNETANAHGYDNILTACSYVRSDSPFYAESQAFLKWRDDVYKWGYALLEGVKNGVTPKPASMDEILADMPKLELKKD